MSRYVNKPHGLYIGSGNQFHCHDVTGFHGYSAMVRVQEYRFENFVFTYDPIYTPAEQLLVGADLKPTATAIRWLNENAPGWGHCAEPMCRKDALAFYFKKRAHAVAFCKWVDHVLKVSKK